MEVKKLDASQALKERVGKRVVCGSRAHALGTRKMRLEL
jgi:hypothetical protein